MDVQIFDDIKKFMKFIMNYSGELKIRGSEVYDDQKLIAAYKQ